MKPSHIIISALMSIMLTSCNDFLEKDPNKTTSLTPKTTEELDNVIDGLEFSEWNDTQVMSTDDYALVPELYDIAKSTYTIDKFSYGLWLTDNLKSGLNDKCYTDEYQRVYIANFIFSYLPKVTGTEANKNRLKYEAHFLRAYSLWNLVQTYCLPYSEANRNELGLILKISTTFGDTQRATLEETYRFIEADLTEALKNKTPLNKMPNGSFENWRLNRPLALGFAARFYLAKGDYDKASDYATQALVEKSELINYNTDLSFELTEKYNDPNTGKDYEVKFSNFYIENPIRLCIISKESFFSRYRNTTSWFTPSRKLLGIFDQQYDLRFKYFVVQNYSLRESIYGLENPYPAYKYYGGGVPTGPGVAEMMLIKAECLARKGSVGEAMMLVNALRSKRMDSSAPASSVNLTAVSAEDAVMKILEERHREFAIALRWYDMRRLNNNDVSFDDVGAIVKQFYRLSGGTVNTGEPLVTYTLEAKSRKYAQPIPNYEIEASKSAGGIPTQQNTY